MKLLWVAPAWGEDEAEKERNMRADVAKVEASLGLNVADGTKVVRWNLSAREFMLEKLKVDELATLFPQDEDLLPEVRLGEVEAAEAAEPVEEAINP
jgi:hypothetical protein